MLEKMHILEQKRWLKTPSVANIQRSIRQSVPAIPQEILPNAVNGVVPRLTAELMNDGQHIGQL